MGVCVNCAGLRVIRIYSGGAFRLSPATLPPLQRGPTTVYVCLCNALTDRQVKQAAATAGAARPSNVYAACGCRAQCGQCVKAIVALLRGEPERAMPELAMPELAMPELGIPELQGAD
jgi:bacterioferritin-associated ferredoxin